MDFEKAKNSYKKNAVIQKKMAANLLKILLKFYPNNFDTVFEIGSGTGFLTEEVKNNIRYKKIILNDITDNYTGIVPDEFIKGDILSVVISNNIDLIVSNACLQWINNYDELFNKLYSNMNENGVFAFSTFGKDNFIQIKDITGIGLSYPDLSNVVSKQGFKTIYFEEELDTLYFQKPIDVLEHIKYTGVRIQNRVWTRRDFKLFEEKYLEKFKDKMGFELTYHPMYYILQKTSR